MGPIDQPPVENGPSFHEFAGHWHLSRRIDHSQEPSADFNGRAVLSKAKGGLWYREDGQLQISGHGPISAQRQFLWIKNPGRVMVLFDDGRPFHQIDLASTLSKDRHHCDPDIYDVEYDFTDWPDWTCVWWVKGPRKDYVMTSLYSREAP